MYVEQRSFLLLAIEDVPIKAFTYLCACTHTHVTLAVAIGRFVMGLFWMTNPPEIYTAAIGLYSLWLLVRVSTSIYSYVTEGAVQFMEQAAFWSVQVLKCLVAGFLLFVVIPLLLGHLVDLFLLSPLRVPTDRTPIFYISTVSGVNQCVDIVIISIGMLLCMLGAGMMQCLSW